MKKKIFLIELGNNKVNLKRLAFLFFFLCPIGGKGTFSLYGLGGESHCRALVSDFLHACDLSKADKVREREQERDTIGKNSSTCSILQKQNKIKINLTLKYFFHELEDVTLKYRNSTVIYNPE